MSVGDFHLPNLVAWALAGEPRADDARMLELLEPYRGQRARVIRLLELSGIRAPRYGPGSRSAGSRTTERQASGAARNSATASANAATVAIVHGVRTAMT